MPNTPHYNKFIINEAYKLLEYNKICSYPKHNEYRNQSKNLNQKSKNLNLEKKKTDKDPDYNTLKEYNAPILKKNDDDNILKIENHTYSFRKDILYNGEELKQFESDYQEIIA
ncbi:hypothetical protein GLOIN_2v1775982 [Rhizophagus irregularis DAOM 181602=DAOM 197198]|uniref:Uncharacterized protein n=1 Tax=Rhizophagus irregularis (strain DAOM 181602 / DAOM 197198 / MUCL 43194) TaxID=747089 RepID=A0A2P4PYA8_RHIID|nr:hypothetical protein GLOIN_2v1775982 [Rhizophagus irregularis DAOM 181602=DAOM 197198]PKY15423.1 hypothetical protein RhiirB3_427636 [Rhizophagus irregularis]POG70364.1 hypothetical protein GLOIN_2v1775982 [Rhizophagus irregularis DAOM 181602=DAOM 197198]GET55782.1 hypothetical protein GLOIN_2v1775982 [Rhizophagus irregularis DAOM 181602=DAOM 197198]CAG8700796.1 20560_t:CDS:2 [Rhizophagus irregularis]|eukprot:XP_025177230.1 hypothetical protein GLOIN_2v1775982 [Rhizophagus irregularis DAOM 181602=DAOM 197198]